MLNLSKMVCSKGFKTKPYTESTEPQQDNLWKSHFLSFKLSVLLYSNKFNILGNTIICFLAENCKDQYHSHICMVNIQPAAVQFSLA